MTSSNHHRLVAIGALAVALSTQAACSTSGSDTTPVHGKVVLVDHRSQALLAANLLSVNGTYGVGCDERLDDWSLPISVGAPLDFDPLSVVMNDPDCVLTLTDLRTVSGLVAATPAITLATSYQVTPSSFVVPAEFYANAKLSALTFAADFVLTILYSDDPRLAAVDVTATFAVAESSVTAAAVPAPDYTLSFAGFGVLTDVNDIIQSVTGSIGLSDGPGPVTGQRYVVLNASGLDLYDEVDAAYIAAVDLAVPAGPASIPNTDFASLIGVDLTGAPTIRTLIIANTVSGVASYQVFEITFHEPA